MAAAQKGEEHQIVCGKIDRSGPGYNTGYTWNLDPNTVQLVDMTIETFIYDGKPSDVDQSWWSAANYCPWSGKATAMHAVGR